MVNFMKAELEQKLGNEFNFMEDAYCECGDGWYELLRQLCAEITGAYNEKNLEVDIEIAQIKEKFGALRFYYHTSRADPTIHNIIWKIAEKYEEKSEQVCEVCGADGRLRKKSGWLRTLCDGCFENGENL